MNRKLNTRIKNARDRRLLKRFDSVQRRQGAITETRCKLCDAALMTMVPDENFREVQRVNEQTVIRERLILARTNNYTEVVLEMDDGGKHVTDVCKGCKAQLLAMGPDDLEAVYMADISALLGFSGPKEYITRGRAGTAKPLRAVEAEE